YLRQTFPLPLQLHKFNSYQVPKKIHSSYHIHVTTTINQHLPFITHNPNYILHSSFQNPISPYHLHQFLIHLTPLLQTPYFLNIPHQLILRTQEPLKILNKHTYPLY
ncbi:ribose-5-phosphate isomerase A, partial [Staphylococcus epidermidis]|uniref:ribose-5-phosphate isomerase A n=1 Tax=Staphylococcus epidermidis TaxID=1282 RepID=UPI00164341FB